MEKEWLGADGQVTEAPDGASATLLIYQTFSGEKLEDSPIARITLDLSLIHI